MTIYKSFVDVLFILLLGSLVMLTQSVQLGAVDTALAKLGAGALSPVSADSVQVVAVGEHKLVLDGRSQETLEAMAARLDHGKPVLLITAEADVRHHRVLAVWSDLQKRGYDVKLGAAPEGS